MSEPATRALRTVALVFLRLGATSFGGPAAHIALMEEEVVRRRRWLTHEEFLDLLGAVNLIPGPNSTEMAIHIGHRVAGWIGLVVAGACFILPAVLIVSLLAWAYVTFGALPPVAGLLYGVKPVVIAIVVQALWKLGRTCVRSWLLAGLALVAVAAVVAGAHELVVLFGAGGLLAVLRGLSGRRTLTGRTPLTVLAAPVLPLANVAAGAAATSVGLWPLFLVFLKVGAVLFGSGYVLLAFLRADLVERNAWMTEQELLDAVAVGQVTPGPLFTTATFIGYLLAGPAGAVVATVGIFLPAFVYVAASVPLLPRLRKSAVAGAFLDGVNVAALALMGVVTWQLGRAAIVDVPTILLALGSAVLLLRFQVNSVWLVLGGGVVGLLKIAVAL
jgi:chromate transporter